jgi:arsenite-transporting ATPase
MELRAQNALSQIPNGLVNLRQTRIPLAPKGLVGIDAIRMIDKVTPPDSICKEISPIQVLPFLGDLIDELARPRHGVILTMGKGGVGKTTVAAAVAVALADRGFQVHLSTTDPAAHLAGTLDGDVPNLKVFRIDPKAETAAYSAQVLATAGKDLDEQGRAMLEEDLRSPCTEEIAVFRAFADAVARGEGDLSFSTPPPPAIRSYCSIPLLPITAKLRDREVECPRRWRICSQDFVIPVSPES